MAAAAAAAVDDTPVAQPTTTSGDADEPTTTSGDAPTLQRYVGLEHMHPLQLQALYAASRFELGKRCLSSRRGGEPEPDSEPDSAIMEAAASNDGVATADAAGAGGSSLGQPPVGKAPKPGDD